MGENEHDQLSENEVKLVKLLSEVLAEFLKSGGAEPGPGDAADDQATDTEGEEP